MKSTISLIVRDNGSLRMKSTSLCKDDILADSVVIEDYYGNSLDIEVYVVLACLGTLSNARKFSNVQEYFAAADVAVKAMHQELQEKKKTEQESNQSIETQQVEEKKEEQNVTSDAK
jgi:hypothetical protein